MSYYRRIGVNREAFATVLQREIDKRPEVRQHPVNALSVYRGITDEIAASGLMAKETAQRRLYAIFNGEQNRSGKRVKAKVVSFEVADKILTALDLAYLWHTDLADALVLRSCGRCGVPIGEYNPDCSECRQRRTACKSRARKRALASRPGSGGLSVGRVTSSSRRGGTGEGTTLSKEAA